jgi:hypothetical protein
MKILGEHGKKETIKEGERTSLIPPCKGSFSSMQNASAVRLAIATSGQSDILAGRAYTGERADMVLASAKNHPDKLPPMAGGGQPVLHAIFARGSRAYSMTKKVEVTIIRLNEKPGKHEVISDKGDRWLSSEKNLRPL